MPKLEYRQDVDGLRAVAVLAVLFFHADFPAFSGGFVGVDVFFVISGYLITRLIKHEIEHDRFSFSNFYIRRVRRLFPALFFTLAASFVAAALLFSPEHFRGFAESLITAILSVSNFYFWSESGYFETDAAFKPLLHTWSLSVEEQFYMFWPAAMLLMMTRGSPARLPQLIVVGSILSLILAEVMLRFDQYGAFFLMPFRLAEFGFGAILVRCERFLPQRNLFREALLAIGLELIAYSVFFYTEFTSFPGLGALIPCIGTALARLSHSVSPEQRFC